MTNATSSSLGLVAQTAEAEPDPALLRAEFNEIMRASESGEFEFKGDPNDKEAVARHAEAVRLKVKRGIELSQILRRQNTGPAKPKAASKGRRKSVDTKAAIANLLD